MLHARLQAEFGFVEFFQFGVGFLVEVEDELDVDVVVTAPDFLCGLVGDEQAGFLGHNLLHYAASLEVLEQFPIEVPVAVGL